VAGRAGSVATSPPAVELLPLPPVPLWLPPWATCAEGVGVGLWHFSGFLQVGGGLVGGGEVGGGEVW
jgi:hypothetical protein